MRLAILPSFEEVVIDICERDGDLIAEAILTGVERQLEGESL